MRKYLENLLLYGGGIMGFIAFFKNDFPPLWQGVSNMSGRAVLLTICITAFVIGLIMKISEKRVTRGNIREKVRSWMDTFQIQAGPLQIPDTYFVWGATLRSGLQIWAGRTHALPGYLSIVASIGTATQAQIFNALDSDQKNGFWRNLFIEMSRSRISVTRNPNDANVFGTLTIEKLLPITNDLSEAMFIEAVREADFDAHTLYWTVEFLLGATVAAAIPASQTQTPPASAGPTGPTGPTLPSPNQNMKASPH